ncbi:MAG: helix-turn-helix transcriptional regulator [Candidatus Thiodiazotropha endolucinida]
MNTKVHQTRALRAAQICREQGITQAEIASAVGASQSQVSRILQGHGLRSSRLLEEVCLYVENLIGGVTTDAVRENIDLIEALADVWDGSAIHAKALSTVIRSLSVLGKPKGINPSKAQE